MRQSIFIQFVITAHLLLIGFEFVIAQEQPALKVGSIVGLKSNLESDKKSELENKDPQQSMLDIPGVKELHTDCQHKDPQNISKCLWDAVQLNEELKKKVLENYKKISQKSSSEKSNEFDLTQTKSNLSQQTQEGPGVKKLKEKLQTKLQESLYGKAPANSDQNEISSIDHARFNELYMTSISKGIVDSLTSYCLYVDFDKPAQDSPECLSGEKCQQLKGPEQATCQSQCELYFQETDQNTISKKNIAILENGFLDPKKDTIQNSMLQCMSSISNVCAYAKKDFKFSTMPEAKASAEKACAVTDFIKASKKNIQANDKILNFYKEISNQSIALKIDNLKSVEKINNYEVMSASSQTVEESYKDDVAKLVAQAEKCEQNLNAQNCKDVLDLNRNDKEKQLAELKLRQEGRLALIDEQIKDDESLKQFLKEQGYSENEVVEKLKSLSFADIKKMISDKYKAESDNLIQELKNKIDQKTAKSDQAIDQNDAATVKQIKDELSEKTEQMKRLVRFNNVVSSYFEMDSSSANKAQRSPASKKVNTGGLYKELEESKDAGAKNIADRARQAGRVKESNQNNIQNITLQTINRLIGF